MAILNPFRWIGPRNVCGAEVRYVLKFVEVLAALCKIAEKTLIALGWLIPTITKNYMVYNQLYLIRHFKQRKGKVYIMAWYKCANTTYLPSTALT